MKPQISTTDKNVLTFTLSALFISALVLGIVFTLEDTNNSEALPTLDVILSKNKSLKAPEKADYLAQNDQQGGGNSEKHVRPQNIKTGIAADDQGNHLIEQVENIPNIKEVKNTQLLVTKESNTVVQSAKSAPDIINKKSADDAPLTKNQKLAKLENNISERMEAYAKRPKSKYISASTKSYEFANYMQTWVKKIERVSNLNYPEEARKRGFVGTLIMTVGINSEGTIKDIKIIQSSGYKSIDDAAEHLVQLSGPFEAIPENINKIDILYITRTWQFLPGNKLKQK
ncbi:MAG: TonB family protein [Proteobacteria bacterium]|nr:TonB family protein [Pseudomonadota bacterium]